MPYEETVSWSKRLKGLGTRSRSQPTPPVAEFPTNTTSDGQSTVTIPSIDVQQTTHATPTATEHTNDRTEKYGLFPLQPTIIAPNDDEDGMINMVDVVAVHGITGDAYNTWTHENGNLWLRDLIPKDLPGVRVFSYGYPADVFCTFGVGTLDTFARSLLEGLKRERRKKEDQTRPIIFICHSMGGIVVKKALVIAKIEDEHYDNIRKSMTGILFLSTPHRGSSETPFPTVLTSIANVALSGSSRFVGAMRPDLIKVLQKDSKILKEISTDFRNQTKSMKVASFIEQSLTPPAKLRIVDEISGVMDIANERIIPMQGCDHRSICRFTGATSEGYKTILNVLQDWVEELTQRLNLHLTDVERKFIEGLPGHDIGRFLDSQEQPQTNSCDWIPKNEGFREFLSSSHTHVLHIVGEPGSGKSTAAAWLFRTSRSWGLELQPLLFSFHGKCRASAAWSALLYQLLHLDGTSTAAVHGALEDEDQSSRWKSEHSSSDPWTFSRLRDVFKSVIGRFPNSFRTLYIIDALDECDETLSVFLKSVVDILQAKPSSRIKFLFLSRRILSSSIDSQFKSVGGTFQIIMNETTAHIENVQRYIQTKVDDLCMLRPGISHLRPEIVQELEQRSVGIYLLASLNLKSLVTAEATTTNIRLVIRTLPGDLQAIYSQALNKVAPGYQLKAAALLLWVVFAVRPLRVCELSAAVAMTCLEKPITSDSDLKDKVSLDILGDMSVLFGPLIRVTGDVVSLVHSSARQYLLSLAPTPSRYNDAGGHYWVWGWIRVSKGWEVDSIAAMASQVLSLNCRELISYASGANISASLPDPTSEDNPDTAIRSLLHYAIESLPDHVRQSPPGPDKDAVFASFLKSDTGRAWMRQFWMLKDPTQAYKRFSPLEFCCALGLVEIAKQFLPLDRYPRIKLPDVQSVKRARVDATELLTAADLAAMFGNVEILRVLCEGKGTPADSDDLIPQTSWKATVSGWVHIGRNYGHDEIPNPAPGTRGEDVANERERAVEQLSWYRPLHTATAYGHAEAAEYLISRGASISRQDESGKWAIEIAMEKSIEGLVQLLLYHHQDDILQLLRRFVEVGNPNSIELLLQLHPRLLSNGVHFKTILGEHNGSILHLAAAAGSLTVYKLLVRLGAKHDLKDSEGRQAIHYAAASGQTAFIQSILADGIASRTDQDALGRNPLFYATLGASCCEDGRWTPVPEREQVIPILVGNIRTIDSKSLVSSALNSLARFSCYESSILPGEDSPARNFERCLRTLHSMAPDITLDGGLLHAAFKSTFFPLEVALDLAPDVNKTDSSGRTALHVAAAAEREWGHWHRELAKMVADIDQRDVGGMTALLLAIHSAEKPDICSHYVLPRIRVLLDRGADATCADVRGVTPISAAAEFLLTAPDPRKHWSEPRAVDDGLLTSLLSRLSTFAENISDEVLPRLIAALATSGRQKDLMSLMKAMSARQRSQWLEQGLDTVPMTEKLLFTCHELGWPPKALSAMASHLDNEQLELVYIRAFQEKSRAITEICRPHLEGHDDASWLDRRGSRLHLINAAQRGDKDTIELFLEVMKGDVDAKDKAGQTMLSHAAEAGHVELTKYLIFRGAESSVPDAKGRTAVYWAAREGKLDALKLLVEADAPVTEEDIGIATSMGREAVRAYLEEHL